jgi:hypothetical protein
LGQRFTLADASAYGQLSMNLVDGRAAVLLQELAPLTYRWLCDIRDGGHRGSNGELEIRASLKPLLQIIAETFIPLMQQNEAAYEDALNQGQDTFNEAAFDRGEALYEGTLMELPFRSVAKSFQVVTWRELCEDWQRLDSDSQKQLARYFPLFEDSLFDGKSGRREVAAYPG